MSAPCSCGVLPHEWWQDRETFLRVLAVHDSHRSIQAAHDVSLAGLSKWRRRHEGIVKYPDPREPAKAPGKGERPGATFKGDEATVTGDPSATLEDLGDIDGLLSRRGLSPDEWMVKTAVVNEWEAYAGRDEPFGEPRIVTMRQLKVFLQRRMTYPLVSCAELPPFAPAPKRIAVSEPQLTVLFGCAQAPYHEPNLHRLSCDFLAHNTPGRWVDLGDTADFSNISRHRDNPAFSADVRACNNGAYTILRDRTYASPDSERDLLSGNHDGRVRTEVLNRAERLHGIKPAWADDETEPEYEALSLFNLWHLDRLGVTYHETPDGGDYEHAFIELTPEVELRHGHLTGPTAVRQMLGKVGRSIAFAHTHHQSVVELLEYRGSQRIRLTGMEVGTMARTDGGLGYAVHPDWHQGFGTVTTWPDGSHVMELARYRDGVLSWRDQRWA